MRTLLFFSLMTFGILAQADIVVRDGWARATPPGATTAAIYLTLENTGEDDRVIAAVTDAAEETQLHTHRHQDGMMRMEEVEAFDLPAGATVALEPGGKHLMLFRLQRALVPGETVRVQLLFDKADRLQLQLPVRDPRRR